MIVTIIVVSWNLQSFVLCAVLMCSWGELSHQPSMDGKKFNSPNECTERRRSSGEKDRGSLSFWPTIPCTQAHFAIILNSCSLLHECAQLVRIAAPLNDGARFTLFPSLFLRRNQGNQSVSQAVRQAVSQDPRRSTYVTHQAHQPALGTP